MGNVLEFIKSQCEKIQLPDKPLSNNTLLMIGYTYGVKDTLRQSKEKRPVLKYKIYLQFVYNQVKKIIENVSNF
jgi:hypothetical protein